MPSSDKSQTKVKTRKMKAKTTKTPMITTKMTPDTRSEFVAFAASDACPFFASRRKTAWPPRLRGC